MNWNYWIRQTHRWMSIVFTVFVAGIFIALGAGKEPADWVYFLPLFPLFVLLPTGLQMFASPYIAKGRSKPSPDS